MTDNRYRICGLMVFILLIFSCAFSASALQVRPMIIDLDLEPGDTEEFELVLSGGALARQSVSLTLMHPEQNIDGRLNYHEINPEINPAVDWLRLESNEVTIPANENAVVRGTVDIPFDAWGSHTAVIMIDNDTIEQDTSFLGFRIRYAVRVNINIESPGQRPGVEIIDFSLEPDDSGRPIALVHFKNTSRLRFPAVADVTIRGEDRRLLERIPLFSQATSLSRRDDFQVYPGSELLYRGEVTKPLFPGDYEIQLFFRYADGRQIIQRETVEITEEFIREEEMKHLTADPEEILVSTLPGASSTQMLKLTNHFSEPLLVKTYQTDIKSNYEHSVFAEQEVDLRGDREFVLRPGGVYHQLLIFRPPRDLKPGGYYGYHDIEVYNLNHDKLEEHKVRLSSSVEGEIEKRAEIVDLSHDRGDNSDTLSLTFKNTGNTHIIPRARVQLFDNNNEIYANIDMRLQQEERILPGFNSFLSAERRLITEGDYKAVVILEADNEELDTEEFSLTIGDKK